MQFPMEHEPATANVAADKCSPFSVATFAFFTSILLAAPRRVPHAEKRLRCETVYLEDRKIKH